MGNEDDGQIELPLQFTHQIDDLSLNRNIERADRFVSDNHPGIRRQRPGNADPLTLSTGELMGIAVEMLSLETKAEAEPLTREELIEKLTRPIYFALDDASLSDQQKEQLKQLASFLLAPENERLNLRIEGHCDDRGTREYNFALGERRAAVISQQLRTSGFPKDRLKTISYGKERLAYSGISEFARARNRRGELILKPVFEPAS